MLASRGTLRLGPSNETFMGMVVWIGFGAAVGRLAAQRRGFSPVTGVVAGLVLGPFCGRVVLYSPQYLDDRAPADVSVLRRSGRC